jgi:hypothetical protein
LLEAVGGRRHFPAEGMVYPFVTIAARDRALDLVRGPFGWTVTSRRDAPLAAIEDDVAYPRLTRLGGSTRAGIRHGVPRQ